MHYQRITIAYAVLLQQTYSCRGQGVTDPTPLILPADDCRRLCAAVGHLHDLGPCRSGPRAPADGDGLRLGFRLWTCPRRLPISPPKPAPRPPPIRHLRPVAHGTYVDLPVWSPPMTPPPTNAPSSVFYIEAHPQATTGKHQQLCPFFPRLRQQDIVAW